MYLHNQFDVLHSNAKSVIFMLLKCGTYNEIKRKYSREFIRILISGSSYSTDWHRKVDSTFISIFRKYWRKLENYEEDYLVLSRQVSRFQRTEPAADFVTKKGLGLICEFLLLSKHLQELAKKIEHWIALSTVSTNWMDVEDLEIFQRLSNSILASNIDKLVDKVYRWETFPRRWIASFQFEHFDFQIIASDIEIFYPGFGFDWVDLLNYIYYQDVPYGEGLLEQLYQERIS